MIPIHRPTRCMDISAHNQIIVANNGVKQSEIFNQVALKGEQMLTMQKEDDSYRPVFNKDLMEMSRSYRMIIENSAYGHSYNEDGKDSSLARPLINTTSAIWTLVEIMMINEEWDHYVMLELQNWLLQYFDAFSADAKAYLDGSRSLGDDKYWDTVYGLMLQGRCEDVASLLISHSDMNEARLDDIIALLQQRPVLQYTEFDLEKFEVWRNRVKDVQSMTPESSPLYDITQILLADKSVFVKHKKLLSNFYIMLICLNLHKNPVQSYIEVQLEIKFCVQHYEELVDPFELIVRGVLELDLKGTIANCCHLVDNPWLRCHLFQILYYCRRFQITCDDISFNEELIIEYATFLTCDKRFWSLALSYLNHCPVLGRHIQMSIIDGVGVACSVDEEKELLKWCDKLELPVQYEEIIGEKVQRLISQRRYAHAIYNAIKSRSQQLIDHAIDRYLLSDLNRGDFDDVSFLDTYYDIKPKASLWRTPITNNRIMFIVTMRKFFKLNRAKEYSQAINILIDVISTDFYPDEYLHVMFQFVFPYLHQIEPLISRNQMMILIHKIYQMDTSLLNKEDLSAYNAMKYTLVHDNTQTCTTALSRETCSLAPATRMHEHYGRGEPRPAVALYEAGGPGLAKGSDFSYHDASLSSISTRSARTTSTTTTSATTTATTRVGDGSDPGAFLNPMREFFTYQ